MRKTLCASVLVLALCGSALAGDMGCPPIAPVNFPSTSQSPALQTDDGSTDVGASTPTADMNAGGDADGFSATALSIINSVLALL